jgi:hypothetical protein
VRVRASVLEEEAQRTGQTVAAVRRASTLGQGPPLSSRPQTPTLLKNVVSARRFLLQTLDILKAGGPGPRQQQFSEDDLETLRSVAAEIASVAEELVSALTESEPRKLRAVRGA